MIFAAFVAGLAFLIFSGQQPEPTKNFVIALLFFATALTQLWINQPKTFLRSSRLLLVFGVMFVQLAATKLCSSFATAERIAFLRPETGGLIAPYAFAPLVLSVLLGRNHGLYASVFVSLWSSILFGKVDAPLLVCGLISGFTAVYLTLQVRRRSRLIRPGLASASPSGFLSLTFGIIGPIDLFSPMANDWKMIGIQSALAIGNGILTATIVGGILPILEHLFQITTDISWLEASDLNHPLLRRMTIEAPGTYHHSLVVANLAESAAEAIGANATLCRVCSYFHDVGKLVKPEYFTENMNFERNPHDDLAPTMSALIIIAHVKEGVDLALKHGLNRQIIDIIQEHHGTSLVYYFYKRALQQQEDARAGGKIMNMREGRYSGSARGKFPLQRPETADQGERDHQSGRHGGKRFAQPGETDAAKNRAAGYRVDRQRIADRQSIECDLTLAEL